MARIFRSAPAATQVLREQLSEVTNMAERARQCVEQAEREAADLLADARREADRLRREAVDEGRRQGRFEAQEELRAEMSHSLAAAPSTWQHVAAGLQRAHQEWLARWEHDAVKLACAIAARLVRRELQVQPDIPVELVREALELAAGRPRLRLIVHSRDLALLNDQLRVLVGALPGSCSVELSADDAIEPGGCRVVTDLGEIDQQWSTQLARITDELTGAA